MDFNDKDGTDIYDVVIIGSGPAGATAAFYTAHAELKTLVIDKGLTTGTTIMAGKSTDIAEATLCPASRFPTGCLHSEGRAV